MKRCAIGLLLAATLLAGCGLGEGPPTSDDPSRGGVRAGPWLRAEGAHEGKPLVWELRADYTVTADRPQLLNVSWHYVSDRADGLPEVGLPPRFAALETRLAAALGAHAQLVATLDYYGQHDWYWYADTDEAYQTARKVVASESARTIAVSVEPDAKGEFYSALVKKTR